MTGVQTCALPILKSDGTVWAWGRNYSGNLGDGTVGDVFNKSIPVQVKGADGEGYLTDVVAVAAGNLHSMALKVDGTVWTWGANSYGKLGDGTTPHRPGSRDSALCTPSTG